ncbi:trimeric intracellular cation channel family protein [Yinghuangia seranimata]|uniref:trimeric intracellular cation channel family protein n=1 Tax=Yinghuangia seranimata TaxID=408067 RepID=UPI00248CBF86|nr:trimeric intracellular cation channel family protein [Yinghuangia seranimata]MDI2129370.1 trimeric intracellular cation channel family protein [Yinghuangia seranimata]
MPPAEISQIYSDTVQQVLDLTGIFVFAVAGALMAVRKNFDVIGIVLLAEVTALGGGVIRDLIIGAVPPAAFTDIGYFSTPLAAAAVVFFLHPQVERISGAIDVFDAAGLGLFCVTGTAKAFAYGLGPVQAAALGVTTAVGGGAIRDVLAREIPMLLRWDREIYTVPALLGAGLVAVLIETDTFNAVTATFAALFAFGFRVLAIWRGWRAPRAWRRNSAVFEHYE